MIGANFAKNDYEYKDDEKLDSEIGLRNGIDFWTFTTSADRTEEMSTNMYTTIKTVKVACNYANVHIYIYGYRYT